MFGCLKMMDLHPWNNHSLRIDNVEPQMGWGCLMMCSCCLDKSVCLCKSNIKEYGSVVDHLPMPNGSRHGFLWTTRKTNQSGPKTFQQLPPAPPKKKQDIHLASATYTRPAASTATAVGRFNCSTAPPGPCPPATSCPTDASFSSQRVTICVLESAT